MEVKAGYYKSFCIGFWCPSKPEHLQTPNTPLATEQHRACIKTELEQPLQAIGHNVRSDEFWPAYSLLPPPFRDWTAETFLLLADLEQMPDGRTALKVFVDWFDSLVRTKIDDILAKIHGAGR
jgi:hypothetical protein